MADSLATAQGDTEAVENVAEQVNEGEQSTAEKLYDKPPENTEQAADAAESGEEADREEAEGDTGEGEQDYSQLNYEQYPEAFQLDEQAQTEFTELAKELGIAPDAAQKLLDFDASRQQQLAERLDTAHAERVAQWESEVKSDKEIGGDHLDATLANASKAIDAFAPEGFTEFLDQTGLGNHLMIVKTFNAIGKAISEDTLVSGREPATGPSIAEQLYPSMTKK